MPLFRSRAGQSEPSLFTVATMMELAGRLQTALSEAPALLRRYAEGGLGRGERAKALELARSLAEVGEVCSENARQFEDELPDRLRHFAAQRVAARLAWVLVALASEEPETMALLTPEEIGALPAEHGVDEWLERVGELDRRDGE